MKQLDLGCGNAMRGREGYNCYGIDIIDVGNSKVKVADLTFDPIPFADNTFDLITAYDFMEHIPMVIYEGRKKRNCMIKLFNEIFRVLKPDGEFYMQSPVYPNRACFQDPTHVSFWTDETPNYFSGDYYGFHDHYGHTSQFEKVKQETVGSHLCLTLRAKK